MSKRPDFIKNPFFEDLPTARWESTLSDARIVSIKEGEIALYRLSSEYGYRWTKLTWGESPDLWVKDYFWVYKEEGRGSTDKVVMRVFQCLREYLDRRDKGRVATEVSELSWEDL